MELFHLAEVCVRVTVALAWTELAARKVTLGPEAQAFVRATLRRPSFGTWLDLANRLGKALPREHARTGSALACCADLRPTVTRRNALAHGERNDDARARADVVAHEGPVQRLVDALRAAMAATTFDLATDVPTWITEQGPWSTSRLLAARHGKALLYRTIDATRAEYTTADGLERIDAHDHIEAVVDALGLRSDPMDADMLGRTCVGRDAIVDTACTRIEQAWNAPPTLWTLHGAPGSGRTAVACAIGRTLRARSCAVFYHRFEPSNVPEFMERLATHVGASATPDAVAKVLKRRRMLIVVDHLDGVDPAAREKWWAETRRLRAATHMLCVAEMAHRDATPLLAGGLPPLDLDGVRAMLSDALSYAPRALVQDRFGALARALHDRFGGQPTYVRLAAKELKALPDPATAIETGAMDHLPDTVGVLFEESLRRSGATDAHVQSTRALCLVAVSPVRIPGKVLRALLVYQSEGYDLDATVERLPDAPPLALPTHIQLRRVGDAYEPAQPAFGEHLRTTPTLREGRRDAARALARLASHAWTTDAAPADPSLLPLREWIDRHAAAIAVALQGSELTERERRLLFERCLSPYTSIEGVRAHLRSHTTPNAPSQALARNIAFVQAALSATSHIPRLTTADADTRRRTAECEAILTVVRGVLDRGQAGLTEWIDLATAVIRSDTDAWEAAVAAMVADATARRVLDVHLDAARILTIAHDRPSGRAWRQTRVHELLERARGTWERFAEPAPLDRAIAGNTCGQIANHAATLTDDPARRTAALSLARACFRSSRDAYAQHDAPEDAERGRNRAVILDNLARVEQDLGNHEAARAYVCQAWESHPYARTGLGSNEHATSNATERVARHVLPALRILQRGKALGAGLPDPVETAFALLQQQGLLRGENPDLDAIAAHMGGALLQVVWWLNTLDG
jgi:hypothetical protein